MTTERISNSIMLDPSLLLARNSIQNTFWTMMSLNKEDSCLKFYYSRSLLRMVNDRAFSREKLSEYFLFNAYPAEPVEIRTQLQENSNILSGFEARNQTSRDILRYIRICVKTYLIF